MRIVVDGVEQLFPPSFLTRLWFAVAPRDLRELAFEPAPGQRDGGQTWLVEIASSLQALERDDARQTISDLVEHLTAEVLSLHPDSLLGQEGSVGYVQGAGAELAGAVLVVLRLLLQLASQSPTRSGSSDSCGPPARSAAPPNAAEEVLAALRAPGIEIHVDSATYGALVDPVWTRIGSSSTILA